MTEPSPLPQNPHFGDLVIERARQLGHCFCLGLDPHLALIPGAFRVGDMSARAPQTLAAVEKFLSAVLEMAAHRVAAVKPQSAFYERLGSGGIAMLERLVVQAHELGVPVILDAKRNDIAATVDAYADAYLTPDSPNSVDAMTINPYMGGDTIEPFLARCRAHGRGVFVLCKTSNPGSGDFQDVMVGQTPLFGVVAEALVAQCEAMRGPVTGWSSLGVVVGATYPEQGAQIRKILPHALFLIPGFGHQQGDLASIAAALVPGPAGREGGLINSARGTLFSPEAAEGGHNSWKAAFEDKLVRDIGAVAECL